MNKNLFDPIISSNELRKALTLYGAHLQTNSTRAVNSEGRPIIHRS